MSARRVDRWVRADLYDAMVAERDDLRERLAVLEPYARDASRWSDPVAQEDRLTLDDISNRDWTPPPGWDVGALRTSRSAKSEDL